MKKVDQGKVSLVDFMRAIRFPRRERASCAIGSDAPFAGFNQRVRSGYRPSLEDAQLVRSAN